MASLQLRGKSYACIFCWHGKRKWFALGMVSEAEAQAKAAQVEYLLMRLQQALIELPPGVEIVDFVRHDANPPEPRGCVTRSTTRSRRSRPGSRSSGSCPA